MSSRLPTLLTAGLWLTALFAIPGISADLGKFIYTAIPTESSCIRMLTSGGTTGCAIEDAVGVLYTIEDVLAKATYDRIEPLTVVMPYSQLSASTFASINAAHPSIAGVILHSLSEIDRTNTSFSPVEQSPMWYLAPDISNGDGTRPAPLHVWNPSGTNLTMSNFPFAITDVPDSQLPALMKLVDANRGLIRDGSPPRYKAQFNFPMDAQSDSLTCLQRFSCLPVGGYNVWTSAAVNQSVLTSSKPVLAAVTQMDANAFLPGRAVGARSSMSGLCALLGAAAAVVNAKANASSLTHEIVFSVFEAETFDLIGSRSFVADLKSFQCRQASSVDEAIPFCLDPYRIDTRFTSLGSLLTSPLSAVFDVSQVDTSPLYYHTQHATMTTALIKAVGDEFSATLRPASNVSGIGLPPSSAWAFPATVSTLVLAGFDTTYVSKIFGGDVDDALSDNALQNICRASTILSRTLLSMAGFPDFSQVFANCSLIRELSNCLVTNGLDCAMAQKLMPPETRQGMGRGNVTHYANVYLPVRPDSITGTPLFIERFFDSLSLSPHFHDALDPAISVANSHWRVDQSSIRGRLWTQSNWMGLRARWFIVEASITSPLMFSAGVVVACSALVCTLFVKRYADRKVKYQ